MVNVIDLGQVVADTLASNPWQKAITVSTDGMTSTEVAELVDAVANACNALGVGLRGIVVDAALLAMPSNAPFGNAFYRSGRLIVVDINLNDAVVIHRS